jgi:dUTP pyrophosphatase
VGDDKDVDNIIVSYDATTETRDIKLWKCDPSFNGLSENDITCKKCSCLSSCSYRKKVKPHYLLYVFIDSNDSDLIDKYINNFSAMRDKVDRYRFDGSKECIDAGIDIFVSESIATSGGEKYKVKTKMHCAMYFDDGNGDLMPAGFYMYPRSSTGSSTPLRLANSVGIIDAGYRGELMGIFDNRSVCGSEYLIEKYQRLLQICSPNLTYPIYPVLVDNASLLDKFSGLNERGSGGFGSTGV